MRSIYILPGLSKFIIEKFISYFVDKRRNLLETEEGSKVRKGNESSKGRGEPSEKYRFLEGLSASL